MKFMFLLLFYFNFVFGAESYCNNKKDYEMYLFTYQEHQNKLNALKKSKNKEKIGYELFQSNFYGLLYNECLVKIKDKEFNRLISSKI